MKKIRENAKRILSDNMRYVNDQIMVDFIGKEVDMSALFTLHTYVLREAKANPNFFRWLFNDYGISNFGTNLSREQKEEYDTWLHDL